MDIEALKALTFGFPQSQWDTAKEEARQQLIAIAKRQSTISYGDLAGKIRSISFRADEDPYHKMLGQISVAEDQAGRGMLSVLVVHKGGDMRPGPGLFELAQQLGRDTSERDRFWADEFNKVIKAWRE